MQERGKGFSRKPSGKEFPCQCRRHWFDPWDRKIPWRRKWWPIPVFLPGRFHGQRSLVGYSPWGQKESDTTEQLTDVLELGVLCLFVFIEAGSISLFVMLHYHCLLLVISPLACEHFNRHSFPFYSQYLAQYWTWSRCSINTELMDWFWANYFYYYLAIQLILLFSRIY